MKALICHRSGWLYGEIIPTCLSDLEAMLFESGFTILNKIDHHFSPCGYTKLWLLGESHFAFHSFPEEQVAYIELSSCVEDKADMFWNTLLAWLQINQIRATLTDGNILMPTK